MTYRLIGALLIILGCGGFGFLIAANYRKEEKYLCELLDALTSIQADLSYRLTPLPELISICIMQTSGSLKAVFEVLLEELRNQISPNAEACMRAAVERIENLPVLTKNMLLRFGRNLGKFDLQGQLSGLTNVTEEVRQNILRLSKDRTVRLRSYRTLGICAGVAIAILLI